MSDIVERLRGVYRVETFERQFYTPPIAHEAADTITSLRAEVERLRALVRKAAQLAEIARKPFEEVEIDGVWVDTFDLQTEFSTVLNHERE